MTDELTVPAVYLSNGVMMPQIGYGVFQIRDYGLCRKCVSEAIACGYRMFDTAAAYFNEDAVGDAVQEAIKKGPVRREDIFLTTKVWLQDYGGEETRKAVEKSLQNLRTDYLDLVLLHQPYGRWKEAWRTLEELQKEGIVRAIGTSNFTEKKMNELLAMEETRPEVNQIEIHPFFAQKAYTESLKQKGIQPEAWGPLCEGQKGIFTNPLLTEIGRNHGKSAAQVCLRWSLQNGNVIIPKSTVTAHMREDMDILNFALTSDEMTRIDAMDIGHSEIIDFNSPATERLLTKWKIHS